MCSSLQPAKIKIKVKNLNFASVNLLLQSIHSRFPATDMIYATITRGNLAIIVCRGGIVFKMELDNKKDYDNDPVELINTFVHSAEAFFLEVANNANTQ